MKKLLLLLALATCNGASAMNEELANTTQRAQQFVRNVIHAQKLICSCQELNTEEDEKALEDLSYCCAMPGFFVSCCLLGCTGCEVMQISSACNAIDVMPAIAVANLAPLPGVMMSAFCIEPIKEAAKERRLAKVPTPGKMEQGHPHQD